MITTSDASVAAAITNPAKPYPEPSSITLLDLKIAEPERGSASVRVNEYGQQKDCRINLLTEKSQHLTCNSKKGLLLMAKDLQRDKA